MFYVEKCLTFNSKFGKCSSFPKKIYNIGQTKIQRDPWGETRKQGINIVIDQQLTGLGTRQHTSTHIWLMNFTCFIRTSNHNYYFLNVVSCLKITNVVFFITGMFNLFSEYSVMSLFLLWQKKETFCKINMIKHIWWWDDD